MGLFDRASEALSLSDVQRLERDVKSAIVDLRDAIDNKYPDTQQNIEAALAEYEEKVAQPRARAAALDRKRIDALDKSVSTGAPLDGDPLKPEIEHCAFCKATGQISCAQNWVLLLKSLASGR